MRRNKQESYLDELLNSVNEDRSPEELEMMSLKSQLDRMKNATENGFDLDSSDEEDRFVQEFERELEDEDFKKYIEDFEREIDGDYNSKHPEDEQPAGPEFLQEEEPGDLFVNTLDDGPVPEPQEINLNGAAFEAELEHVNTAKEETAMTDKTTSTRTEDTGTGAGGNPRPLDSSDLSEFSEIVGEVNGETVEQELPRTEDGEVDLSGNGGMDLMDILGEDENFSEIGDMLSGEGDLGEDAIGDFAEQEMKEQEKSQSDQEEEEEGGKKRRKRKKKEKKPKEKGEKSGGFFAKLATFFFGADEEEEKEEDIIVGLNNGSTAEQLSDENAKILSDMDKEGKGKKKKKKEKKPKKEKPKKEKPKKEKPKKPKKEKPKEPKDNTPPLPKVPVVMIFIMAISIGILVILGTNVGNYTLKMKNARGYFRMKDYPTALEQLRGESVNKKDEEFYNQLTTLSAVASKLKNYETFAAHGNEQIAFDSIVCAAGRYNVNLGNAKKYDCVDELEALKIQIEKILKKEYKMSFTEAVELYTSDDRLEYTNRLLKKLQEMGRVK